MKVPFVFVFLFGSAKIGHPAIWSADGKMRTSCEPAPYYPVGLISGPPVARFAHLVRDVGGMTGFRIPLPITGKYATFNE